MKFCTTHRACEAPENEVCEVAISALVPTDCTLVEALIVPKDRDSLKDIVAMAIGDGHYAGVSEYQKAEVDWVLDALYEAAKEPLSPG